MHQPYRRLLGNLSNLGHRNLDRQFLANRNTIGDCGCKRHGLRAGVGLTARHGAGNCSWRVVDQILVMKLGGLALTGVDDTGVIDYASERKVVELNCARGWWTRDP